MDLESTATYVSPAKEPGNSANTAICNLYGMYRICRAPNLHKVHVRIFVLTLNPTELKWDQLCQVALETSRILKLQTLLLLLEGSLSYGLFLMPIPFFFFLMHVLIILL